MATLEQLEDAFLKADTAGNTDDARVFASEIRKMRSQSSSTSLNALAGGIYGGMADVVGGLADLPNAALGIIGLGSEKPLMGSKWWREKLTVKPMEETEPEDRPLKRAGEVIGGSIPFAAAPFALTGAVEKLPGVIQPIVRAAKESPKTFATIEAGSVLGAAQGAALAELVTPGKPLPAFTGEVAGGFVNPIGLVARGVNKAVSGVKTAIQSFSKAGQEAKAAELIQKALSAAGEDPTKLAKALRETDLPGVSLTAGFKSESPTLIAFESNLASKSPEFDALAKLKVRQSSEGLRKLISQLERSGDPELLKLAARTRQSYFNDLLNARMQAAQADVDKTVKLIGGDKQAASVRASKILEDSLDDAREVERALWAKVPRDIKLTGSGVIEAHKAIRAGMLPEEPLPPAFIEDFVLRISKAESVTSGDVQRFRSQMLMRAREARGQKRWNEARQYSDMAEGALKDLEVIPGSESQAANGWSRSLNDAFTRTFAGDAMAVKGTGADRIPPEAVLQKAFGSGGTMGDVRLRELRGAAEFSKRSMLSDQEEFLRAAAKSTVDPQTGVVNPRALEGFLRENEAILKNFPALRKDLSNASTAQQAFIEAESVSKVASDAMKRRAAFSRVAGVESPSDAVQSALNSKMPQKEYFGLVRLAMRGGPAAVGGLKASTLDYAAKQATNSIGEFSFQRYREVLNRPFSQGGTNLLQMMQKNNVMDVGEVARLNGILAQSAKIERGLTSGARINEVIGDTDAMFDLVVRAVGANIGGASALGQAAGAPIVLAGAGSRIARNLFEKVPRTRIMDVMMEAAKNPRFMATLLEKPKSPQRARQLEQQINAFLLQAGLTPQEETQQ